MDTINQIIQTLNTNDAPMRPSEIAEQTGLDKKEIDLGIKQLKKEERIYSPKRCFYDIRK